MADIVGTIIANAKSTIATTLGGTYRELKYVYDPSRNDINSAKLAYGVVPGAASTGEGQALRAYTLDQAFQVVLTDIIARDDEGDGQRTTALLTMYNKADEIFKALVNTKMGTPTYVLAVSNPALSEPEFLSNNKIIVLRLFLNVKYRSAL